MSDKVEREHRGTIYLITVAHPVADFYPWPGEAELDTIAADIKQRQQDKAILLLPDGRVLDGRTRELCCLIAGVEPHYETHPVSEPDVPSFIRGCNDHRRHMDVSQRAAVAASFATLRRGQHKNETGTLAALDATPPVMTQAEAAKAFDTGERSVRSMVGVKEHAPELFEAVKGGKLSVSAAAKASVLPPKVRAAIAASPEPRKAAEKAIRERPKYKPQVTAARKATKPAPYSPDEAEAIMSHVADVKRALRTAEEAWAKIAGIARPGSLSDSFNQCLEDAIQAVEGARRLIHDE